MDEGFEFELTSGTTLRLVPRDQSKESAISYGDIRIAVDSKTGTFSVSNVGPNTHGVVRFERKSMSVNNPAQPDPAAKSSFEPMTVCHICNGQSCCITNGCGDCGCGWICD